MGKFQTNDATFGGKRHGLVQNTETSNQMPKMDFLAISKKLKKGRTRGSIYILYERQKADQTRKQHI